MGYFIQSIPPERRGLPKPAFFLLLDDVIGHTTYRCLLLSTLVRSHNVRSFIRLSPLKQSNHPTDIVALTPETE